MRIGTRGSELALTQASLVAEQLRALRPGLEVELVTITTTGDRIQDRSLSQIGGKGLFVKEIEKALLDGEVDLAVHSAKDLPAEQPPGLIISAVTRREDPRDVLVSRHGLGLDELPRGAAVGTSSLRRAAQIKHYRTDLELVPLRGNVGTRLRKLEEMSLDAVILAAAGLARMGWLDRVTEYLPEEICLPSAGQGALALETRAEDAEVIRIVSGLADPDAVAAISAERAFLARLEGGCQVPVGALARMDGQVLVLKGLIADVEGRRLVRGSTQGKPREAARIGLDLAETLLASGGEEILSNLRVGGVGT